MNTTVPRRFESLLERDPYSPAVVLIRPGARDRVWVRAAVEHRAVRIAGVCSLLGLASQARVAFSGHGAVNHSIEEYVRGGFWHTNTVENYFSILKRGITGTYHHVSQQHLKRYLGEFDFRYNMRMKLGFTDMERMTKAAQGIVGKRLTYRRIGRREEASEASPT